MTVEEDEADLPLHQGSSVVHAHVVMYCTCVDYCGCIGACRLMMDESQHVQITEAEVVSLWNTPTIHMLAYITTQV